MGESILVGVPACLPSLAAEGERERAEALSAPAAGCSCKDADRLNASAVRPVRMDGLSTEG